MQTSPDLSNPRFRWVIVVAAALLLGIAMGTLVNGLSAFVIPLEIHFGWSRAEVSAINSLGLIGIALGGIVMGFLADRIATRTICLIGAASLAAALLLAARAEALWQFYTLFFAAGFLGGGALFAPVIALVGGWFTASRGLAIGIASAGQGLGQGLVPFVAGHLIEVTGWANAFTLLGAFAGLTLLPLSLLMVPPPAQAAAAAAQKGAAPLLSPKLVLPALSIAVLGCCTGMAVPLMHLVPLIQGVCGVGAEAGGPLLIMLGAAVLGRVFFGRLADIIGPVQAWMAATSWQTALMLGFVFLGTMQGFWLFAPLYGFGYGGVMTGVLITVGTLTPPARRASATGIVLAFGWAGHALGGWQGGFVFDLTGGYFWTYANAVIAGLINLLIVGTIWLALRRRAQAGA
ncbi:MFS transporter [Pseudoruegeria sp. SHC-113]|uniref:MFS transporter n=1 Tax=Pseudoruegeria sp. SHC-113 TaxID=2855439 RepID=UPI0021BB734E|nr:MFS transporter [Pseudoruegeria sp. SHC-113]MCT8158967.1 MFS transporter [Pseudoruegeria sp. SHC-113]